MVDPLQKSLIQVKGQLQRAEERAQDLSDALNEAEEAAKYDLSDPNNHSTYLLDKSIHVSEISQKSFHP